MNWLFRYANPYNFMRLSNVLLPITAVVTMLCLGVGLYLGFTAPPDYQQGRTVLIMFIHVPAVTVAELAYGAIVACSLLSIVWRHPLSDIAGRAAAPLGAMFTVLGMITGALWGRPMWGAFWAWDPRLTSFLLLLFLYIGYMALWNAIEDEVRAARAAAMLALVGAVNIPIIKFSVEWWSSLHQGESIVSGKLAPVFLAPLLIMMLGYALLFASLWMLRIRMVILERRARSLMQRSAA
ncbi:MAG: heme ABC transporter permease CcmC [Alphaproteobacteria bacterium]|nr:heme ABC transporter permease CcmC [Alphaproteobacteria bacterium]